MKGGGYIQRRVLKKHWQDSLLMCITQKSVDVKNGKLLKANFV